MNNIYWTCQHLISKHFFFANYYVNESQPDVTEAVYLEYPGLRASIV